MHSLIEKKRSLLRTARDAVLVAESLSSSKTKKALSGLNKESNFSSKIRKTGLVLLAAPDPVTDIPGIALLLCSYIVKKREGTSLRGLMLESERVMRDLSKIRI